MISATPFHCSATGIANCSLTSVLVDRSALASGGRKSRKYSGTHAITAHHAGKQADHMPCGPGPARWRPQGWPADPGLSIAGVGAWRSAAWACRGTLTKCGVIRRKPGLGKPSGATMASRDCLHFVGVGREREKKCFENRMLAARPGIC